MSVIVLSSYESDKIYLPLHNLPEFRVRRPACLLIPFGAEHLFSRVNSISSPRMQHRTNLVRKCMLHVWLFVHRKPCHLLTLAALLESYFFLIDLKPILHNEIAQIGSYGD